MLTCFLLAVVSSLFFSLYVVPRKYSILSPVHFGLFTGLGFFVGSLLLLFLQPVLQFDEVLTIDLLWSVAAGIVWAYGLVMLIRAIDAIGLSRSNQWKNLQGPIGVLLSLILLGEYAITNVSYVLFAALAMFASAIFFTIRETVEEQRVGDRAIYFALMSAVAFGVVTIINKHVTMVSGVYLQQIVWSSSIFLSLLVYMLWSNGTVRSIFAVPRRQITLGLLAGFLYLGASYFMLTAYRHLPASIGFTIIQLNAVWTIAIGIFFFKEIHAQRHLWRVAFGLIM